MYANAMRTVMGFPEDRVLREMRVIENLPVGDFFVPACYETPDMRRLMAQIAERGRIAQMRMETARVRALVLFAPLETGGGYRCERTAAQGVYDVIRPDGVAYTVDVKGETCTCPFFAGAGDCKHLMATTAKFIEAVTFLSPIDAALVKPPQAVPTITSKHGFGSREAFEKARSLDFD